MYTKKRELMQALKIFRKKNFHQPPTSTPHARKQLHFHNFHISLFSHSQSILSSPFCTHRCLCMMIICLLLKTWQLYNNHTPLIVVIIVILWRCVEYVWKGLWWVEVKRWTLLTIVDKIWSLMPLSLLQLQEKNEEKNYVQRMENKNCWHLNMLYANFWGQCWLFSYVTLRNLKDKGGMFFQMSIVIDSFGLKEFLIFQNFSKRLRFFF